MPLLNESEHNLLYELSKLKMKDRNQQEEVRYNELLEVRKEIQKKVDNTYATLNLKFNTSE